MSDNTTYVSIRWHSVHKDLRDLEPDIKSNNNPGGSKEGLGIWKRLYRLDYRYQAYGINNDLTYNTLMCMTKELIKCCRNGVGRGHV